MPPDPFSGLYDTSGKQWNVDPDFLRAVSEVESGGRDGAVGPQTRSGTAKGRMQFIDATAKEYGVADPHDPRQSVPGAARKMNDLLTQYGNPTQALMAWNGGNPSRWNNPETQAFPGKVAAAYQRLKAQPMAAKPSEATDQAKLEADIISGKFGHPLPQSASAPEANQDQLEADIISGKFGHPLPDNPVTNADVLRSAGMDGQRVGPIPENDVSGQAMGKTVESGRAPGFATQAAVSMATDPEQRRRIMASRLFPGMPINDALSRISYGDDGRMVAIDQKGNPFYAEPETVSRGNVPIYRQNLSALLQPGFYGQGAGAALPLAGGIAGGALAAPTSVVAGPAAAAAGSAIGDAARQNIAGYLDPAQGQPYDYAQTAREAVLGGAGQLGAAGVMRALAPNALLVPKGEIRLAQTGNKLADARTAYARADAQGVDLSPGQATGLRSLLGFEDFAKNNPAFVDRASDFYQRQGGQMKGAAGKMLDDISAITDKTDAALLLQEGSDKAIKGLRTEGNTAAKAEFDAAEALGAVVTPELTKISKTPAIKTAMAKAREIYYNEYNVVAPKVPVFRLWTETKQVLDDAYKAAKINMDSSAGRSVAIGIDSVRVRLLEHLDAAYPTYGKAREIAAPYHAAAARLEASATGDVAGGAGDETAKSIFGKMFEQQNPRSISQARDAFLNTGREGDWYAGVRGYVQDAIDKSSRSQEGLNPSMLTRSIWKNVDVRENLQAALTPQQFAGFERFMTTAEDVAKTYPMNSLTDMRGNVGKALESAAANQPANKLVRGIGLASSPETLLRGGKIITDPIDAYLQGRTVNRVIDKLFSADGMQMLEDMARMPPRSSQATAATLQLMTRGAPQLPSANDATGLPQPPTGNRLQLPSR